MAFAVFGAIEAMQHDGAGIRMCGGLVIDLGLQPVPKLLVFRKGGPWHAGWRHHPGAHFPDDRFPRLRMVANRIDIR